MAATVRTLLQRFSASRLGGTAISLALVALLFLGVVAAQGMPSGEYGQLALGGSVQGSIAAATQEEFIYHTYVLQIPAGSGPVTLRVDGQGSDLDLAVNLGAPITDYEDVDHLDISDDPNPAYTVQAPSGGVVYIDVLNLVQRAASYVLSASAGTGASGPSVAPPTSPTAPTTPPTTSAGSVGSAARPAPSGEYGTLAIGSSVDGVIAAAQDQLIFHSFVVDVPAGPASFAIVVDGMGSDLDLAVKLGAPISDYEDVDFLDTSEDPNPRYDVAVTGPGQVFVDVMNLVASPASYRLSIVPAGGGATPAPQPDNPLGGGGGGANPLASDPLVGTFVGDGLQVIVAGGGGRYQGELVLGGQRYAFQATGGNGRLDGTFASGGQSFAFSGALSGDTLTIESGGATYRTVRTAGGSGPTPAPGPAPADANDPVIAQGSYGTLTQDNAVAFFEALVFAHEQVGYPVTLSQQELEEYIAAVAQAYATFTPDEQAGLAMAREVWNRVQARWSESAPADQQEFVIGMLAMWYGDQQVAQWMGGGTAGSSAGSGGACEDIDSCFSQYADPETYNDAMNAQSCWAAAGCSDYDPSYNEFTYDDYSYDYSTDY